MDSRTPQVQLKPSGNEHVDSLGARSAILIHEFFKSYDSGYKSELQKQPQPEGEKLRIHPNVLTALWNEIHERASTQLHPERPPGWYLQRMFNTMCTELTHDRDCWMTMAERMVDVIVRFASTTGFSSEASREEVAQMIKQIKQSMKEA